MAVVQAKNRQEFINLLTKLGVAKEDFPMFLEVIDLNSNDYHKVDDLYYLIGALTYKKKVGNFLHISKRGLPAITELRSQFNDGNVIYVRDNLGSDYKMGKIFVASKEAPNPYLEKLGFTINRSMQDLKPLFAESDLGRKINPNYLMNTLYKKTYCGACDRAVLKGEKVFYIPTGSYNSSTLCLQCAEKIGKAAETVLKRA
jgi:hypothetical protein